MHLADIGHLESLIHWCSADTWSPHHQSSLRYLIGSCGAVVWQTTHPFAFPELGGDEECVISLFEMVTSDLLYAMPCSYCLDSSRTSFSGWQRSPSPQDDCRRVPPTDGLSSLVCFPLLHRFPLTCLPRLHCCPCLYCRPSSLSAPDRTSLTHSSSLII